MYFGDTSITVVTVLLRVCYPYAVDRMSLLAPCLMQLANRHFASQGFRGQCQGDSGHIGDFAKPHKMMRTFLLHIGYQPHRTQKLIATYFTNDRNMNHKQKRIFSGQSPRHKVTLDTELN
jgi:hypothetical protein